MAKRKRFTPRTQSAPLQVQENVPNVNQSSSHLSPQSDPLGDIDPSLDFDDSFDTDDESFVPTDTIKPTKYWPVNVIVGDGEPKEDRLRVHDLFSFPDDKKVILDWNREGQPIGYAAGLLGGYLGALAARYEMFPINYKRWPKVPGKPKEDCWKDMIKKVFLVDDCRKKWILGNIGKKWKDTCCRLFADFYDETCSWEQNLEFRPDGIPVDQWAAFLEYRLTPKTQEISEKNTQNRAKQKTHHTLGTKTYARKRHELVFLSLSLPKLETKTGKPFGRAKMYSIAHKKKDGSFVNEEARQKSELLDKVDETSSGEDIFVQVCGKEHPGRMRGMGFGPTPTQNLSSDSHNASSTISSGGPTAADYERLKLELKASNARVEALEAERVKVRTLEEQVAFLMRQSRGECSARSDEAEDLRSPAQALRSSSASHAPTHHGPTSTL